MATKEDLQSRIEDMINFVIEADQKAQNDEILNLKALDKDITEICACVTNEKPEIAKELQPTLGTLISRLDELAESLRDYKARQGTT